MVSLLPGIGRRRAHPMFLDLLGLEAGLTVINGRIFCGGAQLESSLGYFAVTLVS